MKKISITILLASTLMATGCQTIPSGDGASTTDSDETSSNPLSQIDKTVGMIGGAALGGLLGNQVGGGSGNKIATAIGVIGGGILGYELSGNGKKSTSTDNAQAEPDSTPEKIPVKSASQTNKFCGKRVNVSKSYNIDVDVAYLRLKRAFDYKTLEERQALSGVTKNSPFYGLVDRGYRHTVQSGVYYQMKDSVHLGTNKYQGWLNTEIEKLAVNRSKVNMSFCEGGTEGFDPVFTKVIKNKLNNALL